MYPSWGQHACKANPLALCRDFSRWFTCWTWRQPSCTRWFWVLRRAYTPCSFVWRRTPRHTSPRWVKSCCWRRESPSTHADRPHTVCQMDWYVTHAHINKNIYVKQAQPQVRTQQRICCFLSPCFKNIVFVLKFWVGLLNTVLLISGTLKDFFAFIFQQCS